MAAGCMGHLAVSSVGSPRASMSTSYFHTSLGAGRAQKVEKRPQWTPAGRLSTSKGYPCDLISRLDFRLISNLILVFEELLKSVLGDL